MGGGITEFPVPTTGSQPSSITAGPDGNLWFTENANRIGRITTSGVATEYPIPTPQSYPGGITSGPDANVWFVEIVGNKLGRVAPLWASAVPSLSKGSLVLLAILLGVAAVGVLHRR